MIITTYPNGYKLALEATRSWICDILWRLNEYGFAPIDTGNIFGSPTIRKVVLIAMDTIPLCPKEGNSLALPTSHHTASRQTYALDQPIWLDGTVKAQFLKKYNAHAVKIRMFANSLGPCLPCTKTVDISRITPRDEALHTSQEEVTK